MTEGRDFEAHMVEAAPPPDNRNGRAFLDKWTGEIIRMSVVIGISLIISYWGLSQNQQDIEAKLHDFCHAQSRVVENQRTVLLSLLRLTDFLSYDITPGNTAGDLSQREKLLQALAVLPDDIEC